MFACGYSGVWVGFFVTVGVVVKSILRQFPLKYLTSVPLKFNLTESNFVSFCIYALIAGCQVTNDSWKIGK